MYKRKRRATTHLRGGERFLAARAAVGAAGQDDEQDEKDERHQPDAALLLGVAWGYACP
ncbi:MAG TPA: hypothetical protein VIG30_16090 [Ktedonobacterales bacterium]